MHKLYTFPLWVVVHDAQTLYTISFVSSCTRCTNSIRFPCELLYMMHKLYTFPLWVVVHDAQTLYISPCEYTMHKLYTFPLWVVVHDAQTLYISLVSSCTRCTNSIRFPCELLYMMHKHFIHFLCELLYMMHKLYTFPLWVVVHDAQTLYVSLVSSCTRCTNSIHFPCE